jgi:hypothetical protein
VSRPIANLGRKLTHRLGGHAIARHHKLNDVISEHLLERRLLVVTEGAACALERHGSTTSDPRAGSRQEKTPPKRVLKVGRFALGLYLALQSGRLSPAVDFRL